MKKLLVAFLLLFVLFSFNTELVTHAAEGDFYEKYKHELESINHSASYTEILKKYDSETRSFNCGKFDLICIATTQQLLFGIGMMNFVMSLFQYMIIDPNWIIQEPSFNQYKGYFEAMTYSLLAVFMIWQISINYAKNMTQLEDYDQVISSKLFQVVGAVFFLSTYEKIFALILSVQYEATSAVLKLGVNQDAFTLIVMKYQNDYSIFFSLILALVLIVFIVTILYRFIAFGFFYIIGPLAIVTMVNEEFNYFNIWFKYIINNVVTLFAQCLCLTLSVASLTLQFSFLKSLPSGVDIVFGVVFCAGFCIFALVIPMILGQLGASTGTGKSLAKMVRFIAMRR